MKRTKRGLNNKKDNMFRGDFCVSIFFPSFAIAALVVVIVTAAVVVPFICTCKFAIINYAKPLNFCFVMHTKKLHSANNYYLFPCEIHTHKKVISLLRQIYRLQQHINSRAIKIYKS
jgi:hypothetical protein